MEPLLTTATTIEINNAEGHASTGLLWRDSGSGQQAHSAPRRRGEGYLLHNNQWSSTVFKKELGDKSRVLVLSQVWERSERETNRLLGNSGSQLSALASLPEVKGQKHVIYFLRGVLHCIVTLFKGVVDKDDRPAMLLAVEGVEL